MFRIVQTIDCSGWDICTEGCSILLQHLEVGSLRLGRREAIDWCAKLWGRRFFLPHQQVTAKNDPPEPARSRTSLFFLSCWLSCALLRKF
jgi:hypothetical protein